MVIVLGQQAAPQPVDSPQSLWKDGQAEIMVGFFVTHGANGKTTELRVGAAGTITILISLTTRSWCNVPEKSTSTQEPDPLAPGFVPRRGRGRRSGGSLGPDSGRSSFVVDAEQVEDGRLQVMDVHGVLGHVVAEVVGTGRR